MTTQEYAEKAVTLKGCGGDRWEVIFSFLDLGTANPPSGVFMVLGFGSEEEASGYRLRVVHILEHVVRFALGAYDDGRLERKQFPELLEVIRKFKEGR